MFDKCNTDWIRGFGLGFFYLSKIVSLCPRYSFFISPLILFQLGLLRIQLPKLTPSILMENCGHFIYLG